jgi:cation diffusion facilitator family transporter
MGGHHHHHPPPVATVDDRCPLEVTPPPQRTARAELVARGRAIRRVFWITLVLNFAVAAAKGVYSYLSGSVTLGADTFHSVLDGSANIIALVGMHLSSAPADAGHPYGHRKFEIIASLGIGVLIAISLVEIAREAGRSLIGDRPVPDIGWAGFVVVAATITVNGLVSHYEKREGRRLDSPLLVADAHHTHSDMYASGAVLLSFVGAWLGLRWADGVGGFLVVVLVGRVAWQVFRENVPFLVDAAVLDPSRVRELGAGVAGVASIHSVRSRGTRFAMELDLHMEVAPSMTVESAHGIAHELEEKLRVALPYVTDVVVHIEPGFPRESRARAGSSGASGPPTEKPEDIGD